jgi:hypothetical protein
MQMLMSLNWFQLFLAIVGAIMIPFIFKRIFFKAPKKKALSMKEYMKNVRLFLFSSCGSILMNLS